MSTSTDPVPDIICDVCDALRKTGRRTTSDPVHCRHCHNTWTGNEAQHCTLCHRTFGVWTDSERASAWFQQHGDPT